jgi:regulator of sigma E protease
MKILAAVLLISILVVIHESGHFLFARLFGVGVKVFSIGFGRRQFGFKHKGTDYRVSLLPIGGYVLMEGADPFQDGGEGLDDPDSKTAFMNKPVWQRLIIVAAGPAFNLILPVLVFSGLFMAGEPDLLPVIGQVHHHSEAGRAGLASGDLILTIDGESVDTWTEVDRRLQDSDETTTFEVERAGETLTVTMNVPVDADLQDISTRPAEHFGLEAYLVAAAVGFDDSSSPLARAGLQHGDWITQVGDVEVDNYYELLAALDTVTEPTTVTYERVQPEEGWVEATLELTPDPTWSPTERGEDPWANNWGLVPPDLVVLSVSEDSAAFRGDLHEGDRILAVDGKAVHSFTDILTLVGDSMVGDGKEARARPVTLTLVRDGRVLEKVFEPEVIKDKDRMARFIYRPIIGFSAYTTLQVPPPLTTKSYPIHQAVPLGVERTVTIAVTTVEVVGEMITSRASVKDSVGGPITIFREAAKAAEAGIYHWANLMAALSISLAVVNFLPVPVLDGGQFLFYAVEGIRGRPLSLAIRERAQQLGVLFIIGLFLVVAVWDIQKWISAL